MRKTIKVRWAPKKAPKGYKRARAGAIFDWAYFAIREFKRNKLKPGSHGKLAAYFNRIFQHGRRWGKIEAYKEVLHGLNGLRKKSLSDTVLIDLLKKEIRKQRRDFNEVEAHVMLEGNYQV